MSPKAFICHRCFVQLDKSVQNKLHKCMKKILLPRMYMCGPGMRQVGQGILELSIGNGFGTFDHLDLWPNDPQINPVIDRKQKGYRRKDLQTDQHVQSNMPSLL